MISTLAKSRRLACFVLATFLSVPAFAAGPVSLQQLIQTGGSLIQGDKQFATFGFTGPTNLVNPANVFVETVALPGGFLGLRFFGGMSSTGTNIDFALFYTVETTNGLPLITEIGQSFVMSASGNGGFVLIGETAFEQGFFLGTIVAQSSIGFADVMDPAGEIIQGDQLIINPPRNKIWVTKDVNLVPADPNSSVGLSNLVQVFCQNQIVVTCPTNRTVGCNVTWNFDPPTATNSCCPGNITITVASTATNQVSPCTFCATRTWVINDGCGNTRTCAQTVCFIRDTTPPVITCPTNLNLGCNLPPACNPSQVVATDDCGPVTVSCTFVDTTNGCSRLRTVFYTAIDQCTNSATCTQQITWIQDTNPPVFTSCPTNLNLGCNPTSIPTCSTAVGAVDDCGPVTVTCSSFTTTNDCFRLRTITYIATDACTNRSQCVQLITWKVDTTPPVLSGVPTNRNFQCFADYLALPAPGVTAFDNCDGTNVSLTAISSIFGTCPIIIETCWTAIDQCSNSVTACVVYTIRDTIPPVITCPSNIVVGCGSNIPPCAGSVAGFRAIGGTASDNCDTNLAYFCFDGPLIGNQIVRTHTVCDDCTNCASCTQIITFVGTNNPPTIICPPDLTVQCTNDVPPCVPNVAQFLAAGGWVSTTNLVSFLCVNGPFIGSHCDGRITRTYTITDTCSNTVTCQQRIFVRDTTPPNLRCGLDKEVQCGTDWFFDIPTASDNCDGLNVPIVLVSTVTNIAVPPCPRIFSVTRTWRATDSCSNSAFCNQTVTIVDTEPPNITCEQDKEELCGIAWEFDRPSAVDKCYGTNVTIITVSTVTNIITPRCPGIFSVTRTWRATDPCGNNSFCNQTVTIVDIEPPNITCEQDKEVQCGTDWAFDIPSAVDKCDLNNVIIEVVSTVTNIAVPRCPAIFSVTRTWRATDTCGNFSFCNQSVTVVDIEPPNITCGQDKDVECGTDWAFDRPGAVDKCDGTNVVITIVSTVTNIATPRCPRLFSVTRTWRATDTCSNASFCNQTVTIIDTEPPNLTCGSDKQVQCGADWVFDPPTAIDGCDPTNLVIQVAMTITNVASPRCPKLVSFTRIWRATDACGNRSFCSQTVTIVDTEPPNLICGANKEVECGTDWFFDRPTAVDLCDVDDVEIEIVRTDTNFPQEECPGIFSVTRTWRATDACGNISFCNQTVTVVDTTPPNLTCGANKEVECGSDWFFDRPTAVDLCDVDEVEIEVVRTDTNFPQNECPGLYSVTRTWRATDICGNTSFCNQTVTVIDTTPPNLICAANKEVECGSDWFFDRPTAVDLCDLDDVEIEIVRTETNLPILQCPGLFSVTRTWRATDICGNRSFCNQTVTVIDTTPPNLICVANKEAECGTAWAFDIPTAVDQCGGFAVTLDPAQEPGGTGGTGAGSGTVTRSGTALTIALSYSGLSSNSTVAHIHGPAGRGTNAAVLYPLTLIPPGTTSGAINQMVMLVDGTGGFTIAQQLQQLESGLWYVNIHSASHPGGEIRGQLDTRAVIELVSTVTNVPVRLCPGISSVTRTWRATDACGNISFCNQTVTLVDTEPPHLVCGPDKEVECGTDWAFDIPTAVDKCGLTNFIQLVSTVTNAAVPLCPKKFSVTRTWRATDGCGNISFCNQTVTLLDTTPPNLTCADDQIVQCGNPFAFTRPTAIDACDGTNVVIEITSTTTNLAVPRCPGLFTVRRTWRAFDTCSNETFCSQSITIVDTLPPNLTCGNSFFVECGTVWMFSRPNAVDLCDGANVAITVLSTVTNVVNPRCPSLITATRTWSATDSCTNTSICSQTITIVDTTPPNLTCADNQIVECGNSWAFLAPSALDICDGTNVTVVIVSTVTNVALPRCPGLFTATRTWSGTDSCSNQTFCSQTITLVDTMPPTLTCAANQIVECGNPIAFTPPFAVDTCDGNNVVIRLLSTVTTAVSPRCPGLTNVVRIWSANDTCGNSNVCSQTITLVDTTPPTLICGANQIVECGLPWVFSPPAAVDACDGTNVAIAILSTTTNTANPPCPNLITVRRTWSARDTCGNSNVCSQTIELVDTTPPELDCANDRLVECGLPWSFSPPFALDICDGTNVTIAIVNTVTNPLCGRTFSAIRTWQASDSCSNSVFCSQSILVVDTTSPNLACAQNRTVECGDPFVFAPPTANDLCDGTNVTITVLGTTTNGLCGATFVAVRAWQATDRCGNQSQCSQTIRVVDSEPPVLAGVPGNQFFHCFADVAPPPPVTAFDFCDTNVTVTFSAMTNGSCPFIITRCWTAVDDCGNSVQTCQSTIVSPPPLVVTGPTNQTVCPGNPATFCAVVSTACPATQQWYRDGVAIPGATNVCYTIPSVTLADAGQYCIAVTGPCQSVTNCARLEVCMAALGDFVWNDLDLDGTQDMGEPGVEDVMVSLTDCLDRPVATRFTDEFGGYLFTGLTAGTYKVTFALPPGYKFTIPNVGNDALDSDANTVTGQTGCYTLAASETNRTVDAGIYQPLALGDFVWLDSNADGVQDVTELGVSSVVVKLMDCNGNVLATTNTDANGFYLFTDLAPDNYNVMFNLPAGYAFTLQDQGGDDALDSDANPATGMTACLALTSGTNRTVDAGLIIRTTPRICVIKEIACLLNPYEQPEPCGTFSHSATGFKVVSATSTNLPAFCYSITVSNCGQVNLTNVTVVDDKFGDLTAEIFASPAEVFVVGATKTYIFRAALEFDLTNTVQTTGQSVADGQTTTAQDSAIGHVLEASIACNKQVSTDGVNYSGSVVIPQDGQDHLVFYRITVANTSDADVTLANLQVTDPLLTGCNIASQMPAALPSGGSFSVVCAIFLNCNNIPGGQLANTATVSGEVSSSNQTACVRDLNGNPIRASSSCSAVVTCEGCQLIVTKHCLAPPPSSAQPFDCSDAKPITSMSVEWNGGPTIYVRTWNGSIGTGTPSVFGPIAPGERVTFTRSTTSTPNDIYFELFTDPSLSAASKLGNSIFHLSCSDDDMDGPEDCGKAAGDSKGESGFINQWIFVGMAGNNHVLDCFPTPPMAEATNTICDIALAQNLGCGGALGNDMKPTSLTFRYTGGGCAAGNNPQSGKFICSGQIDPTQPVTVMTANGYTISPNLVQPGEEFTVSAGSFNAQSSFTLNNNGGTENLSIHTSCSQLLAVGDVFGSLTLVGFNGQMAGADIIYVYTVSNPSAQPVLGIVLTDDKLGTIAGPFDLAAGRSTNFLASASLSVTTTNVATASAGPGCEAQSNPVIVRVPEQPPTLPCIAEICSEFNDKAIAAGNYVWFNGVVEVKKRDGRPGTVTFTNQRIKFTSNGVIYDLPAPDTTIIFSAAATQASTVFDTVLNRWVTTVPVKYNGKVFVGGLAVPAPAGGFAKKLKSVCWSGGFGSDIGMLEFEWKWAAAVYSQFSADYNALGVKPIDGDKLNPYQNSDHAGTPENFKNRVVAGARGGGGSNHTGSYSGTDKVVCGMETETPDLECSSGLVAFLVQYTGPDIAGPLTVKFVGSQSPSTLVATYLLPGGLTAGSVLSMPMESDPNRPWTIDATKHGQAKLGTRTEVYFNNVLTEVFHTSCSCSQNNFIPGQPACLDASSPDNPSGQKGYPSPLFQVGDFK